MSLFDRGTDGLENYKTVQLMESRIPGLGETVPVLVDNLKRLGEVVWLFRDGQEVTVGVRLEQTGKIVNPILVVPENWTGVE